MALTIDRDAAGQAIAIRLRLDAPSLPALRLNEAWNRIRSLAVIGWLLFIRDYRARTRQTFFGSVWAVGQQLLSYLPMVLVGSQLGLGRGSSSAGYAVRSVFGLLIWQMFWDGVSAPQWIGRRMRSLLTETNVPTESVLVAGCWQAAFNASIYLTAMLLAWLMLRSLPPASFILGVLSFPLVILAGLAIGVFVVPLTFIYLDFRYALPLLAPALVWSVPVLYDTPPAGPLHWVNRLNPLTYLIGTPRDWLTTGWRLQNVVFPVSVAASLALLLIGLRFYRHAMPRAIECLPRR